MSKAKPDTGEHPEADQNPGPTRRLDKAIDDIATRGADGTLMSIQAHTGEHLAAPPQVEDEASVTDELNKVRPGQKKPASGESAATMYEPTKAGAVGTGGSNMPTQFGPTGTAQGQPGQRSAGPSPTGSAVGGGPRPVAPFGGKIVVGTRVGQIEVTGVLGKGGMGEVFKGYHHALDINVAIKVLPDELSRNELVRQRFLREARLCVKLDHQNIVRVFNVDEYAGNLFLVMEMVDGTDAAHMLKNGGRFRYKRALEIGAAGADALAYAHTQGLVHRDVKPHNILLGAKDGKIKLSDFGLARAAASSSHLTMSGQIMGTPHYMSPEQAEAKEVTDKSDVYSLGVTLYHMLTGETPFVGDTPISVAVQHIAREILFPEIRFAPFPKELTAVLKRMVSKDPAKRCSAKQAAVWLQKLIAMAPAEDIQLAPDAMQTIAPVVRESQAFQEAAQERAQRDDYAREAARTMLATMREAPSKPTRTETRPSATQSSPVVIHQQSGSGAKITAAVLATLLVVGAGAVAGWWFLLGPGAANNAGTSIASGNGENRGGTADNTSASNQRDNTAPANQPDNSAGNNGGTGNNGGNGDNSGNSSGNTGNNQPANNGSTDPIDINPPQPVDNPLVAAKLIAAGEAIANSSSLADLQGAKTELDRARMEMSKASEAQREAYRQLEASYNRQFSYLSATEFFDSINAALKSYESTRDTDRPAAIKFLNTALDTRASLLKLTLPPETEELVGTDRDTIVARVTGTIDTFWSEIIAEADALQQATTFLEADKLLGLLETLKVDAARSQGLQPRRAELRTLDRHKRILGHIENRDYLKAFDTIKEAANAGVPETLEAAHKAVVDSYTTALEKAFRARLQAASEAAAKADYAEARSQFEVAKDYPLNAEQVTELATARFFFDLGEKASLADRALDKSDFALARTQLDAMAELLKSLGSRTLPADLNNRLDAVRARFEQDLSRRFEGLLAAAQSDMTDLKFAAAGANLKLASDLPLNEEQRKRLDAFSTANEAALDGYVGELLTSIKAALDGNRFQEALDGLDRAKVLPITDEARRTMLKDLQARFDAEAAKRMVELLKLAREYLDRRQYTEARAEIDSALRIPVSAELAKKAADLNADYYATLTGDVQGRIADAQELIDEQKYRQARTVLNGALALPLTDDLAKLVERKLQALKDTIEGAFTDLLKSAADSIKSKLFKTADEYLKEADKLDLEKDQLARLSAAQDALKKALAEHLESLFKELERCVEKGQEAEGKRVIEKLESFTLGVGEQQRKNRLAAALTGETDQARLARLPKHLQGMFGDRYLKSEQLINVGESITTLAVTDDGKFAAAGTDSGRVYFYNLKRGTTIGNSSGGRRKITALAISQDGTRVVSGNDDGDLVLFQISGTKVDTTEMGRISDDAFGLAFSTDGSVIYAAARDGKLTRFNTATKASIGTMTTGIGRVNCMALSPDGKWLAIGGEKGQVGLFDASQMTIKKTLKNAGNEIIHSVSFSAKSDMVMAGSIDEKVSMWDLAKLSETPVKTYKGVDEWIRGVGFSNDGKRCAVFDTESRIVIFDARSGTEMKRLEFSKLKGQKDVLATAGIIGPDGTLLLATREGELFHFTLRPAG